MTASGPPAAGMLLLDKPAGWTSHDCVAVLRKRFPRDTKVGHTGTLDPLATGLLVVLVGPCTKLQARLQGMDKTYSGAIRLGVKTDTGDVTGKITAERPVPALDLARLSSELAALVGTVESAAPAYSAVKHQGRPLYEYARRGLEVPVKARSAVVRSWEALSWDAPELTHRLRCASGTYVRTLAEVLGDRLGCGGTVSSLRRESVGPFLLADALPLDVVRALAPVELARRLADSLPALEAAFRAGP
ncbi:MAG: tRNA pseudouridine(55) synthase TruB [Elusimicrobia bacterium]|nr:tRNA pseudouridine(55) synthase TruB [Elusimicrobiota bacterium]